MISMKTSAETENIRIRAEEINNRNKYTKGINRRLEDTDDLEDRVMESNQAEYQKEKNIKNKMNKNQICSNSKFI